MVFFSGIRWFTSFPSLELIPMIIMANFLKNIPEYAKLGKTIAFPHYGCKACGYQGRLHRHGFYLCNVVIGHVFQQ